MNWSMLVLLLTLNGWHVGKCMTRYTPAACPSLAGTPHLRPQMRMRTTSPLSQTAALLVQARRLPQSLQPRQVWQELVWIAVAEVARRRWIKMWQAVG